MRGHHAEAQAIDEPKRGGTPVPVGDLFKTPHFLTPIDRLPRHVSGRRSYTVSERKRGRYIQARPSPGDYDDIALDATVRRAALYQEDREHQRTAITIADEDLHRKVRVSKTANLVLFAVDASWSMAAAERMEATKGAIMSLLVDSYQKRDRVAMISFQREGADLVLPPTSSVEMAKRALQDLPVGGKTPLSAGLMLAYRTIRQEKLQDPDLVPLMIILTDGAGNVSLTGTSPREEALRIAQQFPVRGYRSIVVNTEHESLDRGLAQELADNLGAPCYKLQDIRAESLYKTVRKALRA